MELTKHSIEDTGSPHTQLLLIIIIIKGYSRQGKVSSSADTNAVCVGHM
jgi:hypothetical protein